MSKGDTVLFKQFRMANLLQIMLDYVSTTHVVPN